VIVCFGNVVGDEEEEERERKMKGWGKKTFVLMKYEAL